MMMTPPTTSTARAARAATLLLLSLALIATTCVHPVSASNFVAAPHAIHHEAPASIHKKKPASHPMAAVVMLDVAGQEVAEQPEPQPADSALAAPFLDAIVPGLPDEGMPPVTPSLGEDVAVDVTLEASFSEGADVQDSVPADNGAIRVLEEQPEASSRQKYHSNAVGKSHGRKKHHDEDGDEDDDEGVNAPAAGDEDALPACFTLPESFVHILGPNTALAEPASNCSDSSNATTTTTTTSPITATAIATPSIAPADGIEIADSLTPANDVSSPSRHLKAINHIKKKLIINRPVPAAGNMASRPHGASQPYIHSAPIDPSVETPEVTDRLQRRGGRILRAFGAGGKPAPEKKKEAAVLGSRCAEYCRAPDSLVKRSADDDDWGDEEDAGSEVAVPVSPYEASATWGNRCVCIRRGKMEFIKATKATSKTCLSCDGIVDPLKGCVVKGRHGHGHGRLNGKRKYLVLKNAKWLDGSEDSQHIAPAVSSPSPVSPVVVPAPTKPAPSKNKNLKFANQDSTPLPPSTTTSGPTQTASPDSYRPISRYFPKKPSIAAIAAIFVVMLGLTIGLVVLLTLRMSRKGKQEPIRRSVPTEDEDEPRWRQRSKFFGNGSWGKPPAQDHPGECLFEDEDDDRTVISGGRNGSREGRFTV
ncbi:hypothetical protein HDU67_003522 [Dinochytrium kinnereticum]|nr:hypothetical protein HDU67_003522 [Dinochytrium kinnereticum]